MNELRLTTPTHHQPLEEDDIIKLNKKEERKQYSPKMNRRLQQNGTRQFRMRGTRWGIQQQTGFSRNRLGRRRRATGKKRPYGVITGLAARKVLGSRGGISPLNRQPLSEKVQAQVQPVEELLDNQATKRTRHSQKPRLTRIPMPPFLMNKEQPEEKKIPKGVTLQFDINSVGKQTGMTLNERFGILKEQRTALSQNKGSRFVTNSSENSTHERYLIDGYGNRSPLSTEQAECGHSPCVFPLITPNLSRNRLSELPAEACHFVSLESLNLYQNCIRYIPEAILNLQSLTFLNISRNQLSTLPVHMCSLPLKVLIASNNKLVSLPEEIGQLRHLTELDVSCNEIQTIPPQIGRLESLRDLNIRRNHLVHLPEELAELSLIRLDFSCNKITTIPVCYRNLRHLQTITLDNNPLQSPPAQICIKGKIHIFKYLNIEACKIAQDLPDYDRRPMGFGSCHEELYSSRPYGALDSGFNSVDSGDKRWSGNEPTDEFSDLPLRVAEITKEQRLRREREYQENRGSTVVTNGGVEHDLDQIDYIDSCATEEEEEEGSPVKPVPIRDFQRTEDTRRYLHQNRDTDELRRPETLSLMQDRERHQGQRSYVDKAERAPADSSYLLSLSSNHNQWIIILFQISHTDAELHRRREHVVERTRREAQLAALQYEEDRMRTKQIQRDAVLDFVKSDDRSTISPGSPTTQTVHLSSLYPGPAAPPSYRNPSQRPESFLFRAAVRDEINKDPRARQNSKQREEELELIEQLRKGDRCCCNRCSGCRFNGSSEDLLNQQESVSCRCSTVKTPGDLGAALTDGVVLCHLANHVWPRSVPSIHVPSPAVPKLTMAKCRRNVENFLEACRKIGVPQERLCLPLHILEEKGLTQVAVTVHALLELAPPKQQHHHLSAA
ncbi:Leucine-rich repeat and calponin like proteiny domain-containing protein 3 [Chelonia mydas]|uniref:Leucine-rich repeat and calponin like proteiny domain-containing protein 3 n=1 Tax=Chelonia mydas TaxID=8469 RepID=M7BKA2_CHEMY|nr:Leucine-rich repeat and calponin like proteiny domain-containing protein 3 [Chelonia mydas]